MKEVVSTLFLLVPACLTGAMTWAIPPPSLTLSRTCSSLHAQVFNCFFSINIITKMMVTMMKHGWGDQSCWHTEKWVTRQNIRRGQRERETSLIGHEVLSNNLRQMLSLAFFSQKLHLGLKSKKSNSSPELKFLRMKYKIYQTSNIKYYGMNWIMVFMLVRDNWSWKAILEKENLHKIFDDFQIVP